MFKVAECITTQHDLLTVALAAGVSLAGMFAFFLLMDRAYECDARRRSMWMAIASFVGGSTVWATHFIAMLAYRGTVPIGFGIPLTVVSAVVIVVGFRLALTLLAGRAKYGKLLCAVTITLSIAAMHMIGMAGIRAAADVTYDFQRILAGAGVSLLLYMAAFQLFERSHGWSRVAFPALLAILGTCTLHFNAMTATELVFNPSLPSVVDAEDAHGWLIGAISAISYSTVILTAGAVFIDRYLTDLKGVVNSTLDGLAVVRDGRIVEVNRRFARLLASSEGELIGRSPRTLFVTADHSNVDDLREAPVEAFPLVGDGNRIFELAVQTVEYRGRPSQVLAVRDLTEKRMAQRQVEYMARHDALTGLPNRLLFRECFEQALAQARQSEGQVAFLALDLDRFKAVNDLFGHAEGDRVLKKVADILLRCTKGGGTVARLGGDEFAILQSIGEQPAEARALAETILAAFSQEMNYAFDPTAVGVSIGVALFPGDGEDLDAIQHASDMALYRAKTSGRGIMAFFDAEIDRETRERRRMESELRNAVSRKQIQLVFQPFLAADEAKILGYEALIRWNHPEYGLLLPNAFLPIAEETGIIIQLGEWVLREACKTASQWDERLSLAVNFSPVQFRLVNLAPTVGAILAETGFDPHRLEVEINEAALLKDRSTTLATLHQLKEMGVRVVMDDFGTGHSSLSNLRCFPFDMIKIDRSFISAMSSDEEARSLVRAIVGLGRSLGFPVTAEGIETLEQYKMIMDEGCSQVQGLYFGQPNPPEALMDAATPFGKSQRSLQYAGSVDWFVGKDKRRM
jgi:diguanylate cyclase (GGDEF)-like protein/PAS domain S-box-containing protein